MCVRACVRVYVPMTATGSYLCLPQPAVVTGLLDGLRLLRLLLTLLSLTLILMVMLLLMLMLMMLKLLLLWW